MSWSPTSRLGEVDAVKATVRSARNDVDHKFGPDRVVGVRVLRKSAAVKRLAELAIDFPAGVWVDRQTRCRAQQTEQFLDNAIDVDRQRNAAIKHDRKAYLLRMRHWPHSRHCFLAGSGLLETGCGYCHQD
jgi:hypothetical protein